MKKLKVKKGSTCMACLACVGACSEAFYKVFDPDKACLQIVGLLRILNFHCGTSCLNVFHILIIDRKMFFISLLSTEKGPDLSRSTENRTKA